MKKVELLSPAGNMECLVAAVQNGADAVYIGGKKFGARKFAANFSYDEMIEAIEYSHLYGVKVYVTVNTLCYEDELDEAIKYIEFLYDNHVDALIMQDLGLISLARKMFPNLEIHASTQAHNHNDSGLTFFKDLEIKRAVLAREMSLDEIKNLKTDIEKEIFIHGALCVSYSGCCLFSAMHGGRSGNRGECVGSCRLPYELLENDKKVKTEGKYLLSTKSLCTLDKIGEIIESGVTSLKIEGRMKSKEYVGYITRIYREKIDEYYKNKKVEISDEEITNIKKLYNRELTNGYLFNKYGKTLMNIKTSNHIGVHLGKIVKVDNKKIYIQLDTSLNQEDGIRFDNNEGMIVNMLYNEKGLLVSHVEKGNIAVLDNKIGLKKGLEVRKTIDKKLCDSINKVVERKVPIEINCKAFVGKFLELSITDYVDTVTLCGSVVEEAKSAPTSYERIKTQIEKLGNTPFISNFTNILMGDNVFVPIKELNELRRKLTEELTQKRKKRAVCEIVKRDGYKRSFIKENKSKLSISILVRNEEQLKAAILNKVDKIYVTDYKLYLKYKDNNVYFRTKRVSDDVIAFNNENLLATELGAICKYSKNNNVDSDYFLNVVNSYTIDKLKELGVRDVTLSVELSHEKIKDFASFFDVTLFVYGRVELMVSKYCPMNMIINDNELKCSLCDYNKYAFKDSNDNIYPIVNEKHLTHILDSKNVDLLDFISSYIEWGLTSFRIDLYDEKENDIENIINKIRNSYEHRNNK